MKKISEESLFQYQFVGGPHISPNGLYTAFIVQRADLDTNCYYGDVWILKQENGACRRLTDQGDIFDLCWLQDGRILFISTRCESVRAAKKAGQLLTAYYVMDPDTGGIELFCALPIKAGMPHILPDGRWILSVDVDLNRPAFESLDEEEWLRAVNAYKNACLCCSVYEEIPFFSNGKGEVSRRRNSLYIFDHTAGNLKKITADLFQVDAVACEFGRVLYTGTEYSDIMSTKRGLYLFEPTSDLSKELIRPDQYYITGPFLLDKDTAILALRKSEASSYSSGDLYILDLKSGELRELGKYDYSFGSAMVNLDTVLGAVQTAKSNGEKLYFLTGEENECYIRSIDRAGTISDRLTLPGAVVSFDVKGNQIIFSGMRGNGLCELYECLPSGGERRLTNFNDAVIKQYEVVTPQPMFFTASDGFEIHGWVLPPVGYVPGCKYPAILHIHGGPRTAFGATFHHEMQTWAANGYFVLFCNPRGSDGRGYAFADLLNKEGRIPYTNLMEFTDQCLKQYPDIDSNNLGVTGGSYGGYMTNWIITHTDRFKAACSQRGISNWIVYEGTTDIGYRSNQNKFGACVANRPDVLWDISPLKYASRVKTPTLFIHSDEDYRCFMGEAFSMFTAIKLQGVESRLVLFKGENHELSRRGRPQARLRRMQEIMRWMDKHLKGAKSSG